MSLYCTGSLDPAIKSWEVGRLVMNCQQTMANRLTTTRNIITAKCSWAWRENVGYGVTRIKALRGVGTGRCKTTAGAVARKTTIHYTNAILRREGYRAR